MSHRGLLCKSIDDVDATGRVSAKIAVASVHGKSLNLRKEFSRPGKSWKMTVVMESHGIPPIGHGIF